ncbi:autotransporter domain-containing protein [Pantoea sp. Al-1710]|uniref:Autotransporter domain-containing protein n=1 Tax=Candidatus Pantoea communis TaxID=2608354 RepID=A0ABX0RNF9_9GAMM|nr:MULTISPECIES: autotransporter domain-containing protein [Pantoea]NIG13035.1 autotransporter domain-containing protein [Pantoea sp. Cy-640]NIG17264.1 autotransporter domain-containing protein [Pantoea communis]
MSKVSTLSLLSLIVSVSFSSHALAQNFDSVTAFGDSLSDGGNVGRFIFDGAQHPMYDELFAQHFGLNLTPSSQGGSNFAEGGAVSDGSLDSISSPPAPEGFDTQTQINNYLQANGGKADPHGLYIHWIGANDIATAALTPSTAIQTVAKSANLSVNQVKQLLNAGAGTVIVPNIPNLGNTPFMLQTAIGAFGGQAGLTQDQIAAAAEQAIKFANTQETPDKATREKALQASLQSAAQLLGGGDADQTAQIYQGLLQAYDEVSGSVSALTAAYNQQEEAGLDQLKGNIVRPDFAGLFNEIINDPKKFGFTNTIGQACGFGVAANTCTSDQDTFSKDQTDLFSDDFHPNPALEKILSDYLVSVMKAPQQVGSLSQGPSIFLGGMETTLDGNLQQQRESGTGQQGDVTTYAGYTGSHVNYKDDDGSNGNGNTTDLSLGVGYNLLDNWQVGVMYAHSDDRQKPLGDFNYKLRGNMVGLFSQLKLFDHWWINGDLHFADLSFDSINRSMNLGPDRRTEQGSTNGKMFGLRAQTGWDIPITDYLSTSPVVGYAWDYVHVGGYQEEGNDSTAMRFGAQEDHTQTGTLGWRIDTKNLPVNPWVEVDYNHLWGDENSRINSGLKTSPTSFVTTVPEGDKNYMNVAVGANIPIDNVLNAYAGVSTVVGNSEYNDIAWNVGMSATF